MASFWIKNTSGKRDAVLTFALVAFVVIIVKVMISGASVKFAGNTYELGEIDAGIIAALLTPTLGAYVARRYTDKKLDGPTEVEDGDGDDR